MFFNEKQLQYFFDNFLYFLTHIYIYFNFSFLIILLEKGEFFSSKHPATELSQRS